MRMIYQYTNQHYEILKQTCDSQFVSRLHWHCHFIQKLKMNVDGFENVNRTCDTLVKAKMKFT
jgi:deoxyribodipyrimidine photo-lyase